MAFRRLVALWICLLFLVGSAFAEEPSVIHYLEDDTPRPELGTGELFEVHLINVASADCILLRMGEYTFLVDSGNYSTADRILDYLETVGVDHLDYAFLTHPHNDHLGGYLDIMEKVPTTIFAMPGCFIDFSSKYANNLRTILHEQAIPTMSFGTTFTMKLGEARLTFYQWEEPSATVNDRSMIIVAEYGDRRILLAADVENNGQRALAEAYGDSLRADIIKMPHHGLAAYMREFHDVVQPSLVTFSNTKSNIANTIRTVEQRGIDWMLTTKGTIVAVTDGETWDVWQIPRGQ